MISKIIALIMAVISFVSGFGGNLPEKAEEYYDIAYGTYKRQTMDIAFPEKYERTMGVVLFIHGGGWISGDKSSFTSRAFAYSRKYGCIGVSMNYRLANEKVDCGNMLEDIDMALDKVKSMAQSRGIKVNKAILSGYSAGAHLSMLYAYAKKNTAPVKPVAVVSYSGPTDLSSDAFINNNAFNSPAGMLNIVSAVIGEKLTPENYQSKKKLILKYSPINYVSSSCVPTIVVQGAQDAIVHVEDTRKFIKVLKNNGVTYKYFELPNSQHSLKNDPEIFEESNKAFGDYINKYLK